MGCVIVRVTLEISYVQPGKLHTVTTYTTRINKMKFKVKIIKYGHPVWPSQDSKRASLERTKSAFITSEGKSDLDARKKRLLQDVSNVNISRSKSDVSHSNRPKPFSSSSDGNNHKSRDSSSRSKPLSPSSDDTNKSSPG